MGGKNAGAVLSDIYPAPVFFENWEMTYEQCIALGVAGLVLLPLSWGLSVVGKKREWPRAAVEIFYWWPIVVVVGAVVMGTQVMR